MRPCYAVEIVTPKKFLLRGLWFGSKRAKRVIIFVHGLGGSAFSLRNVLGRLVDKNTAVFAFNNRGFETVSTLRTTNKRGSERMQGGAAHEVFTECVDDIQGAINFIRKAGTKNIYLAGHSTGCQKSIYWASRKSGGRAVKGIILLAPISDWAAETKRQGARKITRAAKAARLLLKRGKKHELLPSDIWHETLDAQRFLSLYEQDSVEEIFSYGQPKKAPKALESVHVPILLFWAEKDEYGDRAPRKVIEWFKQHVPAKCLGVLVVPRVGHSFKGGETKVASAIRSWMNKH